ncbi:MAG: bifunctional (p)ppGpp synthetase/guanosine-3',5'-bis(diphosphate) 3'-pyrophosphohydrolase [Actinomycetota bacterium]
MVEGLIKKVKKYNKDVDIKLIKRAYEFAYRSHTDQFRKSGEQYILHPLGVAEILAGLELDTPSIAAGLLHDVVEDSSATVAEIEKEFGPEIAALVDGVTKISRIKFKKSEEDQVKSIRKMLVAMAKDIRVILIKLADRLHNMRTLSHLSSEKQRLKAQETLDVYAPLAHRLGMYQIKDELEDLAFLNLYPKQYAEIVHLVSQRAQEREAYLHEIMAAIKDDLKKSKIKAEIRGRAKHYYSIYRKMIRDHVEFAKIYDLIAIRVIVDSIKDCYAALGAIHAIYKPIPGRFKDYIAMPKFNMYQGLHTTVVGPGGKHLEIQIRTKAMHRTAEYGIAAHWRYKEGEKGRDEFEERLAWLRQMLEWQSEVKDPKEFMETLRIDLMENEVYVFTPKGQVLSFPRGATPLDFAYTVHTDVGNTCVGARINGRIVPLSYELDSGDTVEIMTSKSSSGPSRDWLNLVKTNRAKNKIRQYFARIEKKENLELGREALQKAVRKQGLAMKKAMADELLAEIAREAHFEGVNDLYLNIGNGAVSATHIVNRIMHKLTGEAPKEPEDKVTLESIKEAARARAKAGKPGGSGVVVEGLGDVLVRLGRCCNPVPPDVIVGFITRGRGVSIHRSDCPNVKDLKNEPDRFIKVKWADKVAAAFPVEVKVEALDRTKLLRDITNVLAEYNINIMSASVAIDRENVTTTKLIFEVGNVSLLKDVLLNIKKIDGVFDAYRVLPT